MSFLTQSLVHLTDQKSKLQGSLNSVCLEAAVFQASFSIYISKITIFLPYLPIKVNVSSGIK